MADENSISPAESVVAEQFDDMAQQREASMLGMWIFLTTEVLLFGGVFTAYINYRRDYWEGFHQASHHLYMSLGTINTAVLLTSSLCVALAVFAARHGNNRAIVTALLGAILLGVAFLVIKGTEYYLEYREHLIPWSSSFTIESTNPHNARLFFVFYFLMTGLHAAHMIAGLTILLVLTLLAWRRKFTAEYYNPVEIGGLYWHFVDIVWVFLYPALYLVNP